jgi:ADP-ribose pyrophosphatase
VTADSPADFTETLLTTKLVYGGRLLTVREDVVSLPNGQTARREWVQHPGAVIMIPLLENDTVVLERQFRYPLKQHFYELPAGKMEPGEDPLATAQRELQEECGYQARQWRHLTTLHPCVGYSDERIELYLARELTRVGRALEDDEFLETLTLPLDETLAWIRSGRITDVKTIAGLFWAKSFIDG